MQRIWSKTEVLPGSELVAWQLRTEYTHLSAGVSPRVMRGRRSSPSISSGTGSPAAARQVEAMSTLETTTSVTAGVMCPGQRTMNGTRIPFS